MRHKFDEERQETKEESPCRILKYLNKSYSYILAHVLLILISWKIKNNEGGNNEADSKPEGVYTR